MNTIVANFLNIQQLQSKLVVPSGQDLLTLSNNVGLYKKFKLINKAGFRKGSVNFTATDKSDIGNSLIV